MKKSVLNLKLFGSLMILVGLIGFLLLGTNTIGYAVKEKTPFEFSELSEVIAREGGKETVVLSVKNIADKTINNCKIIPKTLENWIYSAQVNNIEPNEKIDFTISVNIPDETPVGNYEAELEFSCDDKSEYKKLNIAVIKGIKAIEIEKINYDDSKINIIYKFDTRDFIGESTYVEIWILNPEGKEIKRIIDTFSINKDFVKRDLAIELPEEKFGTYDIYFSHPSDIEFIKKSVVIGKLNITGRVVFKIAKGKGFPYLIFLIFIGIGIYFIFKSHRRSVQELHEREHSL